MNALMTWYKTTTGDDTTNAVAGKAGLVGSTLSRQLKADTLTPESIVAIARAYGVDPIRGLIKSGLITEEEVLRFGRAQVLREAFDRDIANEVWRRLGDGKDHPDFN